jgi:hypothetical protein
MKQQTADASVVAPGDPATTELKPEWVQHRFQSGRVTRTMAEQGGEAGTIITEEWWSLDLPAEVPVEAFTQAVTQLSLLSKRAA